VLSHHPPNVTEDQIKKLSREPNSRPCISGIRNQQC